MAMAMQPRMQRRILGLTAAMIASLVAGGCSKEEGKPNTPTASSRDGVVETWKKGGLAPSPLGAATVAFGKDCQSGKVNGIDVLLCEYPSEADAKAAEEQGLAWVGDTTGISRAAGKVLIVAADRSKADPSGRTLNQLTKLLTPAGAQSAGQGTGAGKAPAAGQPGGSPGSGQAPAGGQPPK
jgi:hypothetical protein